jgi:putative flavoprotein involved in K+ transport
VAEEIDVVVIGAGQAGLATSHELEQRGVEHVVLEADVPGSAWLGRWDSFTLVGQNHTVRLPGAPYTGDDPQGFMGRTEIAAHLDAWAGRLRAPVRSGCPVRRLRQRDEGGFTLDTDSGTVVGRVVVVSTGAYQRPHRPPGCASLPDGLPVLDLAGYHNPDALPDGPVLVVGSGQSACQVAEELALAGRDVVMACGRAPWFPRRAGDRDVFEWLLDTPFFDQRVEDLPTPAARFGANPQLSGAAGGHDLSYRTLAGLGVRLGGHLVGADDDVVRLAPDLDASVAAGDDGYRLIRGFVLDLCAREGIEAPDLPDPPPLARRGVESVPVRELGSVVVAAGFRPDYASWVDVPGLVDEQGFPVHVDGESTAAPDLHFVGVHFLRRRSSALLFGVGADAAVTATRVASRLGVPA